MSAGVEGYLAVLDYRCFAVVSVCNGCAVAPDRGNGDINVGVVVSADDCDDLICGHAVVISARERIAGACGHGRVLAGADCNVVFAEGSDLLPVSQQVVIHAVPVHVASQAVTRAAVAVKVHADELTSGFIAVEGLDAAGHQLECRALPVHVASREVGIVGGDIGERIVVRIVVDSIGVVLICAADAVLVGYAYAGEAEVDHGIKAVVEVFALAQTVTPVLACHPEILVPVRADGGGVLLAPFFQRGNALGFQLFP